jgi:hypothetical protein
MPVTNQNLYFSRGDTFTFPCLAQDYSQNIINLTGCSIASAVKRAPTDSSPLFTGTSSVLVAASGTFTITYAAASTASLPDFNQVLIYDVQVTTGGGLVYTVQSGKIYLSAETLPS